MKPVIWIVGGISLIVAMTGCARITTQVVEKPRVDQELKGNRGFLVGKAPAAPETSKSRKILETNVEIATMEELNPWKKSKAPQSQPQHPKPSSQAQPAPVSQRQVNFTPAEGDLDITPIRSSKPAAQRAEVVAASTSYTVKSGDTLEKIALKVYGDSSEWRRIYQANKDKLSSPSRIYPGQKIAIPAWDLPKRTRRADSSDLK